MCTHNRSRYAFGVVVLRLLTVLAVAAFSHSLFAAAAPARSQQLTSPDQVPEGLAKSDWSSIRAAYEAGRHAFQPTPTGWQARNPGQQWTTSFDRRGFVATPKTGGWTWGLELQGYGFGDHQQTIAGTPAVQAVGSRLTYQWDAAVQEWFVNDQRGLEHGFTVSTRPAADTAALTAPGAPSPALSFLLAVRGGLRPHVTTDALGVEFRDTAGATVLNYAGLKVWDADGKILTSHFELAASSPSALGEQHAVRLLVDERGARYPITIDPIAQQAYLKASNTPDGRNGVSDSFGRSVAVSGDTVVVGADLEDSNTTGVNSTANEDAVDSGAAYVFVRSGTTWSQQAYLKASNTQAGDLFGWSVAVSGDTVVVGAHEEDSGTTGINSTPDESASGAGAAYVFVRSGTTWTQQAYLKASTTGAGDVFGYSVAVSGDTVVVGSHHEDSSTTGTTSTPNELAPSSGAAYVFIRSGTTWSQQAYLKASNTEAGDVFGFSVAVSGDTVVVGAIFEASNTTGVSSAANNSAPQAGAAYVFVRSGTTWSEQAYLKASNPGGGDWFSNSVGVSGDTVVVGAFHEDSDTTGVQNTATPTTNENLANSGAAYVFVRTGGTTTGTWTQQAFLKASNAAAGDLFAIVAVSGDTVVVGARGEDSSTTGVNTTPNESAADSGAAYVFVRSGTTWTQQAYLKASNPGADDWSGYSVAVSGDTVVVGAHKEDSSTTGANSTANESATDSGAAYVYIRSGTTWSQQAYLKSSNNGNAPNDYFGLSVAVSGDTVVVGAYAEDSSTTGVNSTANEDAVDSGAAYVFVRSGTTWSQQAYLKPSTTGAGDVFGFSVAVSGDTVVVGSHGEDGSATGVNSTPDESASGAGAAYVFVRSGTTWSQQAYLKASNTGVGDLFGFAVAVSGDTVVVGAVFEDSNTTGVNSTANNSANDAGAAYVFVRSGTTWTQQAYLKASNTGADDYFGVSIAVSGDTVVVGADLEDSSTTGVNSTANNSAADAGAAYVFVRSGTTWSEQAYLKASNTGAGDWFGNSVGVSGDTVVVGAFHEDSSTTGVNTTSNESAADSGAAYVFVRSGTTWTEQAYLKASNAAAGDLFAVVAVSGDTVVVGARREDSSTTGVNTTPNESAADSGAAYVFVRSGTTWTQQAYLKASNPGAGDWFGYSVAVSGDTVVVGAHQEDSSTTGVGSTANDDALDAGAVYMFTGLGVATVTTPTSASIAATSATLGGNVTSDGGAAITARGIVYAPTATNPNPQIGGTGVTAVAGSGTTGVFTVSASSLTANTAYTYAAYATTSAGTTYSSGTFSTLPLPPAITNGTLTASGTYGSAITTYTITGSNIPTSYSATGLPAGLSLDAATGAITGTPTTTIGSPFSVTIGATNAGGTGTATLVFTVAKATPTISVAPTASGITYGQTLASSTLSSGTASTAGAFTFTTPSTAPNAGTAAQDVTFTPSDTTNYNATTTTVNVTVAKATPTISVAPTASGITYGQTLASSTLSKIGRAHV